ncbi:hypothetical protein ACLIMP_16765 [Novosphingobium aerophilum]|uniref:hypothetical protein n=1 Tax=Novosphingobium TaxID=165696 RepID=UPI0006C86999|nr:MULTISPECIES: hypothetical protein [unclassified Novosphingobium]KPH65315.1 hypothetical protein ADT71_10500 [Novosphingobium sp. ST904]MPS68887.1 hypothetical protein [Novosphingobium sp.]TCM30763.1 hypothetical protein EDF59_12661 [Novosphingobium sp. ST904]WRT96094.1 hypothetical protein U9J33_21160 [Novosphingobium sp. RL4]
MFLAAISLSAAIPSVTSSFITARSDRPIADVAACVETEFDDLGVSENLAIETGRKVDFRLAANDASRPAVVMSFEARHDGTLILYGFGDWRDAVEPMWKNLARECFPEIQGAVVKAVP